MTAGGGKPGKGKAKPPTVEKPKETLPAGCTRLADGYGAVVSADGRAYAYSLARCLSSLYLVEGLK